MLRLLRLALSVWPFCLMTSQRKMPKGVYTRTFRHLMKAEACSHTSNALPVGLVIFRQNFA